MKLHELKLLEEYATAKKDGIKPFEIRKNDRSFQVGDLVKYNIIEKDFFSINPIYNYKEERIWNDWLILGW